MTEQKQQESKGSFEDFISSNLDTSDFTFVNILYHFQPTDRESFERSIANFINDNINKPKDKKFIRILKELKRDQYKSFYTKGPENYWSEKSTEINIKAALNAQQSTYANLYLGFHTQVEKESGNIDQTDKRKYEELETDSENASANPRNKRHFSLYDLSSDSGTDDEIEIVEEEVEANVWELWKKVLDIMQLQGDIHEYSLEHLNIVQLGNRIGSEITRQYYSEEMIDGTGIIVKEIPNSFINDTEFHDKMFDTITSSNESAKELLAEATLQVFKSNDSFMKFSHAVYKAFVNELFVEDSDVYEDEENYNFRIIWPILDSLSKLISDTKFFPGERRLEAVCEELKYLHNDTTHYYNADGVILNKNMKIEVAILETTGPLNVINNPKETKDYIKAGYGLVSMLHKIGRKFYYGDFSLFKKIGVYFIQATPFKIRVWQFSMTADKLYCTNCIGSVVVPLDGKICEENLRKLINLMWFLKVSIQDTYDAIDLLEESHINNSRIKTRRLDGHENIKELYHHFKCNTHAKLPQAYVSKSERIHMNSSPIRPDQD